MAEVRATFATAAGQVEVRRKEQEAVRVRIVGKRRKIEGTADAAGGDTAPGGAEAKARETMAVLNEGNSVAAGSGGSAVAPSSGSGGIGSTKEEREAAIEEARKKCAAGALGQRAHPTRVGSIAAATGGHGGQDGRAAGDGESLPATA